MLPVIPELGKGPVRGEEGQLLFQPGSAAITGSRVILGMPSHPGPDRIKNDIAAQLQQVGVLLDHNGFETSLKDMPHPCVAPVEFLRVDSVQLPHALREVSIRCLDQEVIVIAHKAISMADPVVPLNQIGKDGEKQQPVVSPRKISDRAFPRAVT